jgi:hypothetical protein
MSAEARSEGRVYSSFAAALLSSDPELAARCSSSGCWAAYPPAADRRADDRRPPGAWALGNGKVSFEMVVERVVDMGNHLHAVGAVGGVQVDLRLRSGDPMPSPGDRVRIAARAHVPLG